MTDTEGDDQHREIKRRPRPVLSCLSCRQKKLKCDRLLPCQQCVKAGRTELCAYAEGQEPELRRTVETLDTTVKQSQVEPVNPVPTGIPESTQVGELLDRLRSLEKALQAQQTIATQGIPVDNTISSFVHDSQVSQVVGQNEDFFISSEDRGLLHPFHNARLYVENISDRVDDGELVQIATDIRILEQTLQRRKTRLRSNHVNSDDCYAHMLRILPEQTICEALISLYFENFEHCGRILHRPTFLDQYHRSLASDCDDYELKSFVPLLLGVLSIASFLNTLKECELPLLRGDADGIGATELLRNWLDIIPLHHRLTMSTLQAKMLMALSMRVQGYDDESLWLLSGQLVRDAMMMGLHTAQPTGKNWFDLELRQRLWVTIIEQDLGNAICCGLPACIPKLQGPIPLNVNDEELASTLIERPQPKPQDVWTDGLCQNVLAQSFNARLEAYNFSLFSRPSQYQVCLEKARSLENAIFNLPPPFKLDHNNPPGRLMAQMELDITLRRPLIALCTPFARSMASEDPYKEVRITWVQSNLVILCFQDLFDPKYPLIEVPRAEGYWDLYYTIYRNDDIRGLRSELLELQRMKTTLPKGPDTSTPHLQPHPHRSTSRVLGWTIKGMGESVEDTIDPLIRRIGRDGADLGDVIRYQLVYDSLRCEKLEDVDYSIRSGLKGILHLIQSRLAKSGMVVDSNEALAAQEPTRARENLQWLANFINERATNAV